MIPKQRIVTVCDKMATKTMFSYTFFGIALFLVSLYIGPLLTPSVGRLSLAARDFLEFSLSADSDSYANLTKRLTTDQYSHAVDAGNRLHCLLGMTQQQAATRNGGTSLESSLQENYMELEGWREFEDANAPYFGSYLDAAFSGLGITKNVKTQNWMNSAGGMIFDDLENLEGEQQGFVCSNVDQKAFESPC